MLGSFVKIKERIFKLKTRTVTTKAEEQNVKDDNFISPSGHLMFVKRREIVCSDVSVSSRDIFINFVISELMSITQATPGNVLAPTSVSFNDGKIVWCGLTFGEN